LSKNGGKEMLRNSFYLFIIFIFILGKFTFSQDFKANYNNPLQSNSGSNDVLVVVGSTILGAVCGFFAPIGYKIIFEEDDDEESSERVTREECNKWATYGAVGGFILGLIEVSESKNENKALVSFSSKGKFIIGFLSYDFNYRKQHHNVQILKIYF